MAKKQVVDLRVEPTPPVMSAEPEVVETPAPAPEPVAVATAPQVESTTPEQVPAPAVLPAKEDVDEFGVPWKNRAMEWKRKSEEIVERLPQMIDEGLKKVSTPQAPQVTFEQYEAYKLQNSSDSNAVAWATGEQRKLQQAENKKLIEDALGLRDQNLKADLLREKAVEYVKKECPMAFRKNPDGSLGAFDEQHPVAQGIFALMRNPQFSQNPEGLAAAADIAYGRWVRSQAPVVQQKLDVAKAEVKQAQKASMTEGSGRRTTISTTPQQAAMDNLKKSGSIKDAEAAVGAIFRARGIIGE